MSRRHVLQASALAAGTSLFSQARAQTGEAFVPFRTYEQLLQALRDQGRSWTVLGAAPDRSPIVAVRGGGTKQPAILFSAGAHATEQAGVVAAVEVLRTLKTDHEFWVLPCRDPIGLSGFRHALRLGLGEEPELESVDQVDEFLRRHGEVVYDADGTLVVVIGEYGYANRGLYRELPAGARFLEPLRGKRIWWPSRGLDTPGAGPLERAYTLVVTPDGEILHLNRFHDTPWAPAEVRCLRGLMAKTRPALTFDMHEHAGGSFFWMSARRQRTDVDEQWERRMASEAIRAVAAGSGELAPESYSPGSFFERLERGVYWLDPSARGEGLNLVDFAARQYGPGFTIESGMKAPFAQRVTQQLAVVETAVRVFEERYA
ncbi:MAG: hypothetical protein AB7O38_09700 [Pirellulaceae bacterium]